MKVELTTNQNLSMNKILATVITGVAMLIPVSSAFAASCSDVGVQCGNGSPELVTNVWGGTNADVPHVQPGQSFTDQWGTSFTCPAWFTNYCVDISHTAYYVSRHL